MTKKRDRKLSSIMEPPSPRMTETLTALQRKFKKVSSIEQDREYPDAIMFAYFGDESDLFIVVHFSGTPKALTCTMTLASAGTNMNPADEYLIASTPAGLSTEDAVNELYTKTEKQRIALAQQQADLKEALGE